MKSLPRLTSMNSRRKLNSKYFINLARVIIKFGKYSKNVKARVF